MKRYEYNLYILDEDNVTSLTFDNILDIPVEDEVMKENLRRIYGTEKINIYQISNEYDIVLKVYIIDEDEFSYEVTDLYQKLASKVVNMMYGIFSKREKEYRSVISKNNSAYLMSKWNILRKNVILKYESLKKSVECANLILSGFENSYIFNDENFRKYYLLEKEKISLLEEQYLKKARDKKVPLSHRQNRRSITFARLLNIAKNDINPNTSLSISRGLLKNAIAILPGVAFAIPGSLKKSAPSL